MSNFSDIRKKSDKFVTIKQIDESAILYSELNNITAKVDEILQKYGNDLDQDSKDTLNVAVDCLNNLYDQIDPENSQIINRESVLDYNMKTIVESIRENSNKNIQFSSGDSLEITPEDAHKIAYVFEELDNQNQLKFKLLMSESIDSYNLLLDFCSFKNKDLNA